MPDYIYLLEAALRRTARRHGPYTGIGRGL